MDNGTLAGILYFVLFLIIMVGIVCSQAQSRIDERKSKGYSNSLICGNFDYLGGFNEITDKLITHIEIINKEFILFTFYPKNIEIKVPLKNITDISTKMEDEVSKDVTLTRLLVFNVFAFGLKKEKHHLQKFLIIKYLNDRQEEKNLIFGGNGHPEKAYTIINENLKTISDVEQG